MKLLFLGFQDHRQPGAGGGAIRNHEVNRRLVALGHQVVVLAASYADARPRCEDGVEYRHIGLPHGYRTRILSYQATVPAAAFRYIRSVRPDVVAEEFSPPWSSLGVGHWTRLPTVGLAHGYFAEEKARQYRLPASVLTSIERWGTRSHPYLITNSSDVRDQLSSASPRSTVCVCGTGLDHALISTSIGSPEGLAERVKGPRILFLGRMEIHQKGLDYLLTAMDRFDRSGAVPEWELIMAGDGPDEEEMRRRIVLMPSRYETYGTVALEAMAAGTPLIHFDIPNLRHTAIPGASICVPQWDVELLADGLQRGLTDVEWRRQAARIGLDYAGRQTWDAVAEEHEVIYEAAARRAPVALTDGYRPLVRPRG